MLVSELKYQVELAGHESHFFSRETMKFFGDTMQNFGCRETVIISNYDNDGNYHENGITRNVYELRRKRVVKHGLKQSAYFDKVTFRRVFEKK